MKCAACQRKASEGRYCQYHLQALASLQQHYRNWQEAYGEIQWNEFLSRLLTMKETGSWIRQVVELEMAAMPPEQPKE